MSLVDTDNIDPVYRYDYALDMLVWAEVMAYRTDAFKGAIPVGWADFWNTSKFPGDRALGGAGPSSPELEFALMAAGVPPDKVYPIDIDTAFASYDKIKAQRGEVVGDRRDPAADADRQGGGADLGLERPHGGDPGRRRSGRGKLAPGSAEARLLGGAEGRAEQGQRDEVHRLQHHGDLAGAAVVADPVWLRSTAGPISISRRSNSNCCRARRRSGRSWCRTTTTWWVGQPRHGHRHAGTSGF